MLDAIATSTAQSRQTTTKPPWPVPRWLVGAVIVAFLVSGLLIFNEVEGPAYQTRQQALAIIQQEAEQLPSYTGAQPDQLIVRNEPFVPTALLSNYSLSGTCEDLQRYYSSTAPTLQWHPQGGMQTYRDPLNPTDPSRTELHSEFTKSVQGVHLLLVIECYLVDSGYSLDITQT